MKTIPILAVAILFSASVQAQVVVRPVGLTVGSPEIHDMHFSLKPRGVHAGTVVNLLITGLDHPAVKVDNNLSSLDKATDSTGKDLLEQRLQRGKTYVINFKPIKPFPQISKDGKQLIVEVATPQAPAKGATGFTLQGNIAVMVSAGKINVNAVNVATQPGQIMLGEHPVQVVSFGPSDWKQGQFKLVMKMDNSFFESIASWDITSPDGTKLSGKPFSSQRSESSAQVEFAFAQEVDQFNIQLEVYDGLQQIDIPVDAQVGLGFD